MGQKVNPIANRLGIIRGWDSNWFGGKDFSDKLVEDAKIRKYLNVRLQKASISKIIIERTLKLVTVTISTARPGIIIGKGGQEVDKLKEELKKLTGKEIQINIFEVKRPEVDAVIVGQNIARQLEGRVSFRRAVKTAVASTMRMGAEGIKIQVAGRVGGAEMARTETVKARILDNLSKLAVDVDRNRLEQEMIFYLEKLDITEEKVRLTNHCNYFREVASSEEGAGRKLGFIAQEMGREINTMGSKANEPNIQILVVKMKDELEKIKEQVLNIL